MWPTASDPVKAYRIFTQRSGLSTIGTADQVRLPVFRMSAAYRFSRFEEEGNFRMAGNDGNVNDEVEARKKPRGSDFAVCVPPLYGTITPATLIQFVELTRMLGAQHFVFYVGDVSDRLRRVLGAYEAEAVATTIPWAIPPAVAQSTIGDILRHRRLSLFSHVARLEFGVPAHDALRLMVDTYEGRKPMASGAYHRAALATSGSARFRRMPTLSCYQRCGGPVRAPGLYE